ncbi:helix-turn-helix transcriptional regulator [Arthrobacter koreensis]|uniref:helix-turn-helix transcriptional regulator n=1 Tax=Arthrobacter koreensis TaxID=199136 RepID=UPI002DBF9874|nr:WYL domain-containing protein [Arthrobacter koreensis]MEB7503440.1 WYL domain-containing protein [Arthrobacter koreensis]
MSPKSAEKRTERLLNLVIALLSSRRGFTKQELFEEIELYSEAATPEAREKLFDRDKAFLREQGIPVESYSDDPLYEQDNSLQRYRIRSEEYRLPEVSFTPAESAVLALAAQMWEQAALGSAAARALRKLRARGVLAEDAAASPVHPAIRTSDPNFARVFRAVTDRTPISFGYRASSGEDSTRTVQPWGMGSRYGHWYLVGWDTGRNAERWFRLSRMTTEAKPGKGSYTVPPDFNIHTSLASLDSVFAPQSAAVDVRAGAGAELRLRAAGQADPGAALDAPPAGWDRLWFAVTDLDALAADAAALGTAARAVHPPELKEAAGAALFRALGFQAEPVPEYNAPAPARGASPKAAGAQERLSRLLDLVPYILANQGAGMAETADRFGVSQEQLASDLNLLFVSGPRYYPNGLMDVNFETGEIYIDNAESLSQPVRLSMDEAAALVVGLDTLAALPGAAPTDAVAAAHAKLTEAAGMAAAAGTSLAAELLPAGTPPDMLSVLQKAVTGRRRLAIRYVVPSRDEVSDRVVDPRRIFSDNNTWYLDAWCHRAQAGRFFRVDRILSAKDHGEAANDLPDPDPQFPSSLFTPGESDEFVTIRLLPDASWVADAYHAEARAMLPDGSQAVVLRTASTGWIPGFIARLGGSGAVLEPAGLRAETLSWLRAARENYA